MPPGRKQIAALGLSGLLTLSSWPVRAQNLRAASSRNPTPMGSAPRPVALALGNPGFPSPQLSSMLPASPLPQDSYSSLALSPGRPQTAFSPAAAALAALGAEPSQPVQTAPAFLSARPLQPAQAPAIPLPGAAFTGNSGENPALAAQSQTQGFLRNSREFPGRVLSDQVWAHALNRGFQRRSADWAVSLGSPGLKATPLNRSVLSAREIPPDSADAVQPPDPAAAAGARWTLQAFFSTLLLTQLGLEMIALSVSLLTKTTSDSFLAVAGVLTGYFVGLISGSFLGGTAVDWFGSIPVYRRILIAQVVVGSILLFTFHSLPLLIALWTIEGLLIGARRVAEGILPTLLYGSAALKINGFGLWQQSIIEAMGIIGPLLAYRLIKLGGFAPVIGAYPLLLFASALISYIFLRAVGDAGAAAGAKERPRIQIAATLRALATRAILGLSALSYILGYMMTYLWYYLLVPAYGYFIAGTEQGAAHVATTSASLFATGGLSGMLLSALLTVWSSRRLAKRDGLEESELARSSLMKMTALWLLLATAAELGIWLLASGGLLFGLPATYLFILPYGLAGTAITVHLESLIKSEAPPPIRGTVLGTVRGLAQIVTLVSFLLVGWLFDHTSQAAGGIRVPLREAFVWVAVGISFLVVPLHLWVARNLLRRKRPHVDAQLGP